MIYIETNSMDPFYNFAFEHYFMKEHNLDDDIFLFWRTHKTLMIGRYQNTIEEINLAYAKEKNVHIVRRPSGGGTIYTDPNGWQFSFIVKTPKYEPIDFKKFTAPIIEALDKIGVTAYFNDRNDLLIDGKKISGNAQHRTADYTLHHGSILFDTDLEELVRCITVSEEKIISKGLKSIRQRVTNVADYMDKKITSEEFKNQMISYMSKDFNCIYSPTSADLKRINEIADEIYRQWQWNFGNSPEYQITKSKRFEGGKVQFCLNVDKGYITQCEVFGDFFYSGDITVLTNRLIGCAYRHEDITTALENINAQDLFHKITIPDLLECII